MDSIHGYEIAQFALFDNGRGMAIANNPAAVSPFVTWQFTEEDEKRDYYWGHYLERGDAAAFDLIHRVNNYQKQYGVSIVNIAPEGALQARYCYYSTQRPVDLGTFPTSTENPPMQIINYDWRKSVEEGKIQAWGELAYPKPLTQKEMSDYELKAALDNPDQPTMRRDAPPRETGQTKGKKRSSRNTERDR